MQIDTLLPGGLDGSAYRLAEREARLDIGLAIQALKPILLRFVPPQLGKRAGTGRGARPAPPHAPCERLRPPLKTALFGHGDRGTGQKEHDHSYETAQHPALG
ncbi:hypothetical protein [Pseudomonas sp. URMO17WK12:I12]|uniref:hypothetical protein n=1 Tax=Pseudomonas sp. URMO17WK12:I12 TaxID=1259797 RepID=UPI0012DE5F19|nr:hypothetical protein [Pseudomonas sp. URMO17WK12:I12]